MSDQDPVQVLRTYLPPKWQWLLTLPAALTLFGLLSGIYALGPVGLWIHDHWLPVTRHIWAAIFGWIAIPVPDDVKDTLTAIVFFLPLIVRPGRDARWGPDNLPKDTQTMIAAALGVGIIWLLSRDALDQMNTVLNSGLPNFYLFVHTHAPWVFVAFAVGILMCILIFDFPQLWRLVRRSRYRTKSGKTLPALPSDKKFFVGLYLAVLLAGSASILWCLDHIRWSVTGNGTPFTWGPKDDPLANLPVLLACACAILSVRVLQHRGLFTQSYFAAVHEAMKGDPLDQEQIHKLIGGGGLSIDRIFLPLGILGAGAATLAGLPEVGWGNGIALVVLAGIVTMVVMRTPKRIMAIGATFIALALASLFSMGVDSFIAWAEALS